MSLDITEFTPMLKEYYTPERVEFLGYKDHPFMRMVKKKTDWTGSKFIQPVHYETSQAIGHNFADAQGNIGEGKYERFEVERALLYGFAQIDRLAMKASAGKGARSFLQAYTTEVDGVLSQLGTDISRNLFQGRNRVLGVVADVNDTGPGGAGVEDVIVLSNREDVVNFHVGMRVVASTDGSAANIVQASSVTVVATVGAIDRSAGTLTMQTPTGTPADLNIAAATATASFGTTFGNGSTAFTLHREGTMRAGTGGDLLGLAGLAAWIPATAPGSSDSFFGVNRSADADRLAGIRINGSGFTTEDSLIEACVRLMEANKRPDYAVMNPQRLGYLIREVGSKVVRDDSDATKKIGTRVISLYTPSGEVKIFGDASCPINDVYVLTMNTWHLVSTGVFPEIFDEDLRMLRVSDADAYTVRMGGYGNLSCKDPGANARILF